MFSRLVIGVNNALLLAAAIEDALAEREQDETAPDEEVGSGAAERPALTRDLLAAYRAQGKTIQEIADATGYSKGWVSTKMDEFDIEPRGKQHSYQDLDDDLLASLDRLSPCRQADLRAVAVEGRAIAEQAAARGVSPSTVATNLRLGTQRLEELARERDGS